MASFAQSCSVQERRLIPGIMVVQMEEVNFGVPLVLEVDSPFSATNAQASPTIMNDISLQVRFLFSVHQSCQTVTL